ncbi:2-oxoacid:acceptor oxidoreductase family protein [bacterium]|nr:2-oxoacid:acceptor oxidoreductase family protein [bacterium]
MIEIRLHGRGGQGAVIASKIMAVAMFSEGKWVQAFPKFGVERRGAPVEAFLRLAEDKILIRSEITEPDHIIVLDPTLVEVTDVTAGLKKNGWIVINSSENPDSFSMFKGFRVGCVNASQIASNHRLGAKSAPIVNTAICGAFARATGLVDLESVCNAILTEAPVKPQENAQAARDAFEAILLKT